MKVIIAIIVFVSANYAYQAFGEQNWSIALERSYFQAIAILIYEFIMR